MTISQTEEDHEYQSERGGVGMVIDDVSVHRTSKEASMNGGSVSSEGLLEKPKEKPSKKSKPKSAKKSGKAGTPLSSGSDEHRHSSDPSERTEPASPTVTPTRVGRLSGEPEDRVGADSVGGSTMTIDVDELDVDEPEVDRSSVDRASRSPNQNPLRSSARPLLRPQPSRMTCGLQPKPSRRGGNGGCSPRLHCCR